MCGIQPLMQNPLEAGLWEGIRSWGGSFLKPPKLWKRALIRGDDFSSSHWEDWGQGLLRTQKEGSHLPARKRALPRPPWPGTSQPPEVWEINVCCLSHTAYDILLQQPELTETSLEKDKERMWVPSWRGRRICN
jgi:hypothetical protein